MCYVQGNLLSVLFLVMWLNQVSALNSVVGTVTMEVTSSVGLESLLPAATALHNTHLPMAMLLLILLSVSLLMS
jgi:hypothetical protein